MSGQWVEVAVVKVEIGDGHLDLVDKVVAELRESLDLWAYDAVDKLGYTLAQVGEVLVA